ncbi:hypothetical protein AAFC00_001729 [Neodothiora populina]|uniref:DUF6987 domain-containing protein n=1 Tax=Neodothiora populina TaxID=2781224 RepID=A0ABR3PQ84_9PEZI
MAPSPAAGKASGAPRTPTKLGRKPQSSQTGKLGQAASNTPASGAKKPSAPKLSEASKPDVDAPEAPEKPEVGDVAEKAGDTAKGAQDKAGEAAKDVSEKAADAPEQASKVEMKDTTEAPSTATGKDDDEDDDDEGPLSKVSQAGDQAKGALEEQAPKPIDDSNDDTVGGAQEAAEETADDAEDNDDNATEKAGDTADDTADDATDDAQETAGKVAGDTQDTAEETGGNLLKGAKGLAGKASGLAGKASQDPSKTAKEAPGDVKETAEDTAEDVKDTAEDAAEGAEDTAGDVAEGAEDTAEDVAEGAKDTAEDAVDGADDTAEGAKDTAEDAVDGAKDTAEDAQDTAEDAVDGAEDTAEDAKDTTEDAAEDATDGAADQAPDLSQLPLDLSVLKGVEVAEDGLAYDSEGNAIGKLAEGDAEDLAGYPIGDDGEILDDDGDLVGRVELLPDEVRKQMSELKDKGELPEGAEEIVGQLPDTDEYAGETQLPGLDILKGLTCDPTGLIYNDDGDTVGQVVDGDPQELMNATLNENGEFIDDDGNVVGHAQIHEDAANLVDQAEDTAEGAAGDATDAAEDAAGEADGIEDELPGIEALEGKELNDAGEIVDDQGNVLGEIEDQDLKDKIEAGDLKAEDLKINDAGEVVDEEGNVLGKVGLAEGAAEKLAAAVAVDLRILDGRKVNKKGKVLDDEGEEIGELTEGEIKDCAGQKINDKGEVLDKDGKIIGKVAVVPGEAAEAATRELQEALGETAQGEDEDEAEEESGPQFKIPDLDILEGLKVNKKGKILNEDGEEIGELTSGDLAECTGKKVNEQGEVLDAEGNVIGRVKTLPQEIPSEELEEAKDAAEDAADDAQDAAEDAQDAAEDAEDAGPELPPLSVLEGLSVNKAGKLVDSNGTVVGELIEGDAKKLSKSGLTADAEGQFWDNKGHILGRAKTVPIEEPDEEGTFAGLEGLIVVKDGYVEDENGNRVGVVVEGDAKKLVGRAVDEDGDIIDKKGSVVGHADRWEEPEEEAEPEAEPLDLSSLAGKTVNKMGMVIGDEGVPVARLIEGNAKELAGRKLDGEGQLWNDSGKVIGRVELIPEDERESKPEGPFAGRQGLRVVADGKVADEDDNVVGQIVEGNPKRLIGLTVDEDGDIIDKYGNVKGHAEPLEEEEELPLDNSILDGKKLNKQGFVVTDEGIPIGKLIEGNVKELAGRLCDENGDIHNDTGKVVGHCEVLPENERVAKPEGAFAGREGLHVNKEGKVEDAEGNVVGIITEGNVKKLIGLTVDEDGDINDKFGNVKGHAEPWEEEEEQPVDNSILDGKKLNKQGFVVNEEGIPIGKLVEGNVKELAGRRCDENGNIYSDTGKVVGHCEALPENERVAKPEGPFAGREGLHVNKEGMVEDGDGNVVGVITEGNAKKLVGLAVDEDGDINDKFGNVKGHAEPYEEEEQTPEDLSALAGCTVNKAGNVVDSSGTIMGRVSEGDPKTMIGKKVDGQGQIWDNAGNVIGRAELAKGQDTSIEGPFAGFDSITVDKEGMVVTPDGTIVGRIVEGDVKKLIAHKVDEEGEIQDKNGNIIGKAERWEPEEKERKINPMSGRRVNKEGEVRDENGDVMGRLTAGDLGHCVGLEVDDNGYVVDNDGNKVGEVTLLENIAEEEEEELSPEEQEELRKKEEERQVAEKMGNICQQTLERIQPVCKQITDLIEKADRTPREELDEEELVNNVKPLIEEGSRILQECNGSLRGLDPDGHIAAQAKGRAGTKEASPEEYRLADTLKELTSTVVTTIDNAKKRISDMPHAKKKLNPLWGLLTQPLFQILAAVGLLLTGVLGLVGQLLNGLGLGGLVNGLLGGLGIDKLLGGLGLGSVASSLGIGKKDKKKSGGGASSLPIVGGLFGGK